MGGSAYGQEIPAWSEPDALPSPPPDPNVTVGTQANATSTGPGSGVPTQHAAGIGGALLGAGLGSLLIPGLGTMIGGRLGSMAGHGLARMFQHQGQHPQQQQHGGGYVPPMPQGSVNLPSTSGGYNPFGGLPEGFQETNRFGMGAPTFTGPGATGPQFGGGSIFNANLPGGRASPLAGAFFNLGGSGGQLGDFGAKGALHSGRFLEAVQNMGYSNLNDFLKQTGFQFGARGLGGGQNIAGAGRPMNQNY